MRAHLIIGTALALATTPAMAGGKAQAGSSNYPTESVGLTYGKIQWEYSKQKPDGTTTSKRVLRRPGAAR